MHIVNMCTFPRLIYEHFAFVCVVYELACLLAAACVRAMRVHVCVCLGVFVCVCVCVCAAHWFFQKKKKADCLAVCIKLAGKCGYLACRAQGYKRV